MSFCTVIMMGNLTADPELRYTPKGTGVCQFNVAINRKWKSEAGEMKEEVSFIGVTAFGKTADTVAKFFSKGDAIIVHGRLKQETWDDKTSGAKRSKTLVVLEQFNFAGGKRKEAKQQAQPGPGKFVPPPPKSTEADDEQVPF